MRRAGLAHETPEHRQVGGDRRRGELARGGIGEISALQVEQKLGIQQGQAADGARQVPELRQQCLVVRREAQRLGEDGLVVDIDEMFRLQRRREIPAELREGIEGQPGVFERDQGHPLAGPEPRGQKVAGQRKGHLMLGDRTYVDGCRRVAAAPACRCPVCPRHAFRLVPPCNALLPAKPNRCRSDTSTTFFFRSLGRRPLIERRNRAKCRQRRPAGAITYVR